MSWCTQKVKSLIILILFYGGIAGEAFAQDKITIGGYVSNMGSLTFQKKVSDNTWDYLLHNRINLAYYPTSKLTGHLEFRNQFFWGETVKNDQTYAKTIAKDRGLLNMNFNWFDNSSNFLNTQVDRAYLDWVSGKLEVSVGRQRINWGRTLVWNPNDIFNAYSFYDFDYPEKPGSDAVRLQYYTGMASAVELVAKTDSSKNMTLAGLGKFNLWGYDFQVIGGYVNNEDMVIGAGWEGNIKSIGFRGEMSYYYPTTNFSDTTGSFLASVGFDYSFPNSSGIQFEFLYNDKKTLFSNLYDLYRTPASSKTLSLSETNFFLNGSYPVNPILTLSLASMYYTDQKGFFLMPGLDISAGNNLMVSMIYQYFNLEYLGTRVQQNMAFIRVKWSF